MKFAELHIAVVTFHPPGIYFPLSHPVVRVFRGSHEKTEREKRAGKNEKDRNKTRENMINRETKGENTRQGTEMCVGSKRER